MFKKWYILEGSQHGVITANGEKDYKETKNWLVEKGETIITDLEFENKEDSYEYLWVEESE